MKRITVALVIATAGLAFADDLVLHAGDSVTIDGKRYSCDDPTRRGVSLSPGDAITAGGRRVRCEGRGDTPPPPASPDLAITSSVSVDCIGALYRAISGKFAASDAPQVAESCRGIPIGRRCKVSRTRPDPDCYSALYQAISGSFGAADGPAAQRACEHVEATCPAYPTKATSRVDLDCINKLYRSTPGKPDGKTMVSWLESCRDRAIGTCVVVSGSVDLDCVGRAYQTASGKFSPDVAVAVAKACRTVELRCE